MAKLYAQICLRRFSLRSCLFLYVCLGTFLCFFARLWWFVFTNPMVAWHVCGFVFRFAKQVLVEFDGGFVALEFCIRMSIVILFIWEAFA